MQGHRSSSQLHETDPEQVERMKAVVGSLLARLDEKDAELNELKGKLAAPVGLSQAYIDAFESKRGEAKELADHLSLVEDRLTSSLVDFESKYATALASFENERTDATEILVAVSGIGYTVEYAVMNGMLNVLFASKAE